jgi:phosphoribosylaminoimidazole-succinocarboxamide synthase
MTTTLFESNLHSLPLMHRGKVRDNYAVGDDRMLMIATDRISAFDVVMSDPIPGKGEILTKMALFWFKKLEHVAPNHLTGEDPESVVAEDEKAQVRGRSMLVKRLTPIPIEAVVRGYLAGSAWKEYQATGAACGVKLPSGLSHGSQLPEPIFTPATKAAAGEHDENITFEEMAHRIGGDLAATVRDTAIALYGAASDHAKGRSIIIADTKFEFGLDADGRLTVMDEMLTPDSSRFWFVGPSNGRALDKQLLRNWLSSALANDIVSSGLPGARVLPLELIGEIASAYKLAADGLNIITD